MLEPSIRRLPDPLETFLRSGFWAVGTFFVLSGFVLARGYASTRWERHSLVRYAAARVARIYPVYFLSLVVVAAFVFVGLVARVAARLGGVLCHVNAIPLTPTAGYNGQATDRQRAGAFKEALEQAGVACTIRLRRGIDIQAGCGQLAGNEGFQGVMR
jgi:uncharacterized membrane protein YphA (DoxX/SURF4 family)